MKKIQQMMRGRCVNGAGAAFGLLLAGFIAAAPTTAAPLPALKGEGYDQARTKLIKLGYRPVRFMRTEDACLLDKTCKRYPELLNCWPTGPAHCEFVFSKGHREYALVTTRGEPRKVYSIAIASRRERMSWPRFAKH